MFADGKSDYEMVYIGVWMFFCSSFVDYNGVVKTYLPFCIILFLILLASGVII